MHLHHRAGMTDVAIPYMKAALVPQRRICANSDNNNAPVIPFSNLHQIQPPLLQLGLLACITVPSLTWCEVIWYQ